jgi:hypothetical protein
MFAAALVFGLGVEALERLGRLHEQGVLTDEEFAAEKASLMPQ